MRKPSKIEKPKARQGEWEEYYELLEKHLLDEDSESDDFRSLAKLVRNWQTQRRGEIPEKRAEAKAQRYLAQLYEDRRDKAAMENDHAFFRRLSRALKLLNDSPKEAVAPVKPFLAGRVILTAQRLHGQGEKPTPTMIRDQLERDQGRRISDRQWQRLQPLAKKIARFLTAK